MADHSRLAEVMEASAVEKTKVKLGSVDMEEEEDEGRGNGELAVIPFVRARQAQSDASFWASCRLSH